MDAVIRSIGGIVAQVTIEERHHDETTITSHPVERGANITDHAFDRPAEVTITAGWSNSSKAQEVDSTGALNYVRAVYEKLLSLKAAHQTIDVLTGKRSYKNMLIRSLDTVTNSGTENSMIIIMVLQEIIVVETQTIKIPPTSVQTDPASTGGTVQRGTQQLKTTSDVPTPAQTSRKHP